MNILVTGANGQLGTWMRNVSKDSDDNYIFTDVNELDITDRDAVRKFVKDNSIHIIVNCAAYTNVEAAEDNENLAMLLNADAVGYLAEAVKENDGLLIHVSTDYVFGGSLGNTPRTEEEPVNPTGAYGRTKLRGEEIIAESGVRAIVLRTAWLYSEYGKNFLKTMLNLTAIKPELNVIFDQVGTPTYAGDLANAIFSIINDRKFEGNEGIYHYSNEGVCSWFDFTKEIARVSGQLECDIRPCHSVEFPSKVIRPAYSVLDKTKFKNRFGISVPYWTDSVSLCIDHLNNQKN